MTHTADPVPDPTARLQAATDHIRALATAATPGPWRQHDTHLGQYGYAATVLSGEGNDTELRAWLPSMSQQPWDEARNVWPDAQWIAAMHPGVGEALAAVLDQAAQKVRHYQTAAERIWDLNDPKGLADAEAFLADRVKRLAPALALADAILAGTEQ